MRKMLKKMFQKFCLVAKQIAKGNVQEWGKIIPLGWGLR
jgi:hypothetical protein